MVEKRNYYRIQAACKITITIGDKQRVLNSHTENISAGGMMVIMEEELKPNMIIDLEVFLWFEGKSVKCKGEVIWVNEITPKEKMPPLFVTGIKFIELSDSSREDIRKFVNTLYSAWQ